MSGFAVLFHTDKETTRPSSSLSPKEQYALAISEWKTDMACSLLKIGSFLILMYMRIRYAYN